MIGLLPWVKLPSTWIEKHGLKRFKSKDSLADEIAALMVLVAIAHRSSVVDGSCRVTYEVLSAATQISRAKISSGLDVLADRGIVIREPNGRSTFQLANFTPDGGWCQIPASRLYNGNGVIEPFRDFRLRRRAELDALKAYLLIACRRDTAENRAHLTYKQINEYSGIPEGRIKSAISLLTVNHLIVVDQLPSKNDPDRMAFAYRLAGLETRRHQASIEVM